MNTDGSSQNAGAAGMTTLPSRPAAAEGQAQDLESERWEREERAAGVAMSTGPGLAARVQRLGSAAISVLAGMGLAAHFGRPVAVIAVIAVYLVLAGLLSPAARRWVAGKQQPHEPEWVADLVAYRAWLPRRVPAVPAETLAAADRILGKLARPRWRSAHLFIARFPDGHRGSMGGTQMRGNRVHITLGGLVAEGDPDVAAATLAHEARHVGKWQCALHSLTKTTRSRGLFVIGWAVPWPAVIPAVLALQVSCMLLSWAIEVGCDLGAAADTSPAAMMATYAVMDEFVHHRSRAMPMPKKVAVRTMHWVSGPDHPPIAARRAIIRARYGRRGDSR